MSRRFLSSRVSSALENNPYQATTIPHTCTHQRAPSTNYHPRHNGCRHDAIAIETALSDDTCTESYYDYQHSDESGSTRLPSCIFEEDERVRRSVRGNHQVVAVHKDVRRVYPQYEICEPPKRAPTSHLSDRPQSSMSSGVTSAIVDGCGGKCQTFENVCYFILQLVFIMGILMGVSLCIAGLALRKSAAKNLQVLVYIGILLAAVSGVLLGIQWRSRNMTKRRKMAVRNAKRGPIPLETLNRAQQQPLMVVQDGQRVVPVVRPPIDQQGIPWWRRKDLV